jgi:hypothetical protein
MHGTMRQVMDAHLRCLERDGIPCDDERRKTYSALENEADVKASVERTRKIY